ncbi:SusD/RagB family nutrient-binding outer membrane lipoprotein [Flavobacteriaceae bacterium Ap0902]|nr:SusD/RagB family nutrient-binding outer membrane lipoprotein [Flavobacteriaceae bacterium Ap0902]
MKIFNKILIGALGVMMLSCTDYLEDNESPNSPLIDNLAPTKKLAAAQSDIFRVITGDNRNYESSVRTSSLNQLGSIWSGVWSVDAANWTGAYSQEYTGNINNAFYDSIWDWIYLKSMNFENIKNYESDTYDNHKAIAMILESFYMQYIVDLYGDVPYTEAWILNPTPVYDDQKFVYRSLYNQLDEAIELIQAADSFDEPVGGEDVMLNGNMQQWIAFANTVKLRYLIRQSEVTDPEIQGFITQEINELRGATFISSDVTINPGYNATSADRQNPFYGAYGYSPSGEPVSRRKLPVASEHIANIINSSRTDDPRRAMWFIPDGSGEIVGVPQGEVGVNVPDYVSFFGSGIIPTDTSIGSSMDGYVMLLSEAKFLLAEAEQRWGGFGNSAEQYFNEGVMASFDRFGLTIDEYDTYMNRISNIDGFGWNGTSDKIEAIINQKWLALMLTNGMEAYLDNLRTGYPEIELPLTNTTGGFPKRLLYPSSEIQGNAANVPTVSLSDALANGSFWVAN